MLPSNKSWANDAPAEGTKCLQSNNPGPTLPNINYLELMGKNKPGDLPY